MRILIVSERYWPEVGAAPSRLANMAEGLHARGCEVDVLTSLPNYPKGRIFDGYRGRLCRREEHNGINLFRYWIFATVSRSAVKRALNMFSFAFMLWLFAFRVKRVRSYDVVIIQTPALVVAVSAMWLFKGLYRRKCALNVSDIWPSTAVDMGVMKEGSTSYRFMHWCEKYLYRKSDAVLGQSNEILEHVARFKNSGKLFLYRNLQKYDIGTSGKLPHSPLKVVFCGMLGVAQDVAGIVRNVPFSELGVEFHIIGGGKQAEEIEKWCAEHPSGMVFLHGFVAKEQIPSMLREMDVSIVPLAQRIRGAVPSKIYDLLPQGLPILFCGEGEAADFIASRGVGYCSAPGDYNGLIANILSANGLSSDEFKALSARCIQVSREELDFDKQMGECCEFLKAL
jgi:glycosyltransferase involved in cell wall biosynthesis